MGGVRVEASCAGVDGRTGQGSFDHIAEDMKVRRRLWAIFAYTSRQFRSRDRPTSSAGQNANSILDDQYRLSAYAKIPKDFQDLTRTHAQALLILALCCTVICISILIGLIIQLASHWTVTVDPFIG